MARELLRDAASLAAVDSLQHFVEAQGGNGTRYRCEYSLQLAVRHVQTAVHKLVYMGTDGVSENKWSAQQSADAPKPAAHPLPSNCRWLNDALCEATRHLAHRLEENARVHLLHMSADFVLDEHDRFWFVGAANVLTQSRPPPVERSQRPAVGVCATLQNKACMGDFCHGHGTWDVRDALMRPDGDMRDLGALSRGSSRGSAPPSRGGRLGAGALGGSSRESTPSFGRRQSSSRQSFRDGSPGTKRGGGKGSAAAEPPPPSPATHTIAYKAVLLSRMLREERVEDDDACPEQLLITFEAKVRKRMELYYRPVGVCEACFHYYTHMLLRRSGELTQLHEPLCRPSRSSTSPTLRASASLPNLATASSVVPPPRFRYNHPGRLAVLKLPHLHAFKSGTEQPYPRNSTLIRPVLGPLSGRTLTDAELGQLTELLVKRCAYGKLFPQEAAQIGALGGTAAAAAALAGFKARLDRGELLTAEERLNLMLLSEAEGMGALEPPLDDAALAKQAKLMRRLAEAAEPPKTVVELSVDGAGFVTSVCRVQPKAPPEPQEPEEPELAELALSAEEAEGEGEGEGGDAGDEAAPDEGESEGG